MITLLFGTYGSGKTTRILESIAKDTANGIHTFLIVPEQEAVQSERATLELLPPSAQLHLEVLNFSRLYNRACREYGGLSYRYATPPVRHLLMWQNLRELSPILEEYGAVASKDSALTDVMLSSLGEWKASGVTPTQMEEAARQLPKDAPLAGRLRDLALIFASYDRLLSENYSDSADDLARLFEILQKEKFFTGSHVYLDSFTSFTAMEHRIIERIFAQAENVTISIPLPSPNENSIASAGVFESLSRVIRNAELHGGYETEILNKNHRATYPALSYLAENLWRMGAKREENPPAPTECIHPVVCDSPYEEAEAAAAYVLELLRAGERCRDILILTRNPDRYHGILEPALEKNDIPYYFSQKTDLCTLPPVKLLLSALRIKQYHFQKSDVISHIKTGMYDFSDRSCDLLEEYMEVWNIRGNLFTDGDFTMNPDGFSEILSERGRNILEAANEIRRELTDILGRFFILLEAAENVPAMCQAVYAYFQDIHLEERILSLAKREADRGNIKEAQELASIYGILLSSLSDIASALPDLEASTEEFTQILKIVFSKTDIGTIPTSVDEVTVGSAAVLRAANPKYVLLLGLCEGEFPARVEEKGLLSSGDRSTLSQLGIELFSNADTRSSDELMYVERAFAAPSHGLYLFTTKANASGKGQSPSLPFNRVRALFEDLTPHDFDGSDLRYLAGAPKSAVAHLREKAGSPEGEALLHALREHIAGVEQLSCAQSASPSCQVSPETAASVLGDRIRFSSSRFEKYVECPFNYYCTYVLGLREKKQATFRVSHMGTFIHYVLEQLLRFATVQNETGEFPSDEDLIRMTEEVVAEYVERICPESMRASRRLKHLYTRLKRLSLLIVKNLVEEFSHSRFKPVFFELNTSGRGENPAPLEFSLKDGSLVSFSGIIDRVDLLKKDGELYIRVVDYKTGTKAFSLEDVSHGINIQMLLYLFTLCRNQSPEFRRAIGLEDGQDPTAAGVVYLSANIPVIEAEDYDSEEEILKKAADSLKRSGLLLDEEEILLAMNTELSPKFLAGVKRNKEGAIVGRALTDRESFSHLYDQIAEVIERIATELRQGNANADPIQYQSKNPCDYCNMRPICRREQQ